MPSTVWTKVKDVATREPVVVPPQTCLRVAAEVMAQQETGAVVVATDRGAVGIGPGDDTDSRRNVKPSS